MELIGKAGVHASYLKDFFDVKQRTKIVDTAVKKLKRIKSKFDAIAFSGMSGALMAPIVAHELGKRVIAVRKPDEKPHSSHRTEGVHGDRYIILDDFIFSGDTLKRIKESIEQEAVFGPCVGCYLYSEGYSSTRYEVDIAGEVVRNFACSKPRYER